MGRRVIRKGDLVYIIREAQKKLSKNLVSKAVIFKEEVEDFYLLTIGVKGDKQQVNEFAKEMRLEFPGLQVLNLETAQENYIGNEVITIM